LTEEERAELDQLSREIPIVGARYPDDLEQLSYR
jgi:hypothetical protein